MSDLRLKCTKFDFRWGSAPDPLAVFSWAGPLRRGGRGKKERRGKEGGKEGSACIQLVDQSIFNAWVLYVAEWQERHWQFYKSVPIYLQRFLVWDPAEPEIAREWEKWNWKRQRLWSHVNQQTKYRDWSNAHSRIHAPDRLLYLKH